MLKVCKRRSQFERLSMKTLKEASILEVQDLQKMILADPDAFFGELGEDLLIVGREVKPSDMVGDSIDILAVDKDGNSVIIELKRSENKLQMLQALSYAAMMADWTPADFVDERQRFAGETPQEASDQIRDSLQSVNKNDLNRTQRVILLAENFDFALLKTAEWLSKKYEVNLKCYKMDYAVDGDSEYLACTCVYPPKEIVDYASRVRRPSSLATSDRPSSWEQALSIVKSEPVRAFFQKSIEANREQNIGSRQVYFRLGKDRKFGVCARSKHAWAWQGGRFHGDVEFWQERVSLPAKVKVFNNGSQLSFNLATKTDFDQFEQAVARELVNTEIMLGGPASTEDTMADHALATEGS